MQLAWLPITWATLLMGCSEAAATNLQQYYAHAAVLDHYGVIAPWYEGPNGQCDLRVRIAAETLKRYPWTTTNTAVAAYPDYLFTSKWQISSNGVITPQNPGDWMNGDLGQRSTSVLNAWVDYYRYTGDAAAVAHMTYMGDYLLDHALTPPDHPWPSFPISVPTKGVPYGNADPRGMIQLDICGDMGAALLRAYQVTGNKRWFEAAKHWGDLFAAHCNFDPNGAAWPRYANPESCPWKGVNEQTGGVTMILSFLDQLIRLGYTGEDNAIIKARDAGRRYLSDQLLPKWMDDKTWGLYFWDWPNPVQNCSITAEAAYYITQNHEHFPNWRADARNILATFLNRSSVNPASGGDVYSGAWAYPESSSCCGRSLWYAPLMDGAIWCQYAVVSGDSWARELGYRQLVLQTYDAHENGVTEDNIDGGIIVNGNWLNIAHPLPLRWVLRAIGWLPEELGASGENHVVRSTAIVSSIRYGKGNIEYTTYDAPADTIEVLRLAFTPQKVFADGQALNKRRNLSGNGYTVQRLPNGDAIVNVRHDGAKRVLITGIDPQMELDSSRFKYGGSWSSTPSRSPLPSRSTSESGATASADFRGTQIRLIGPVLPEGGLADVFIDGEKQLVPIDAWNPSARAYQVLYYKNGLKAGNHTLRIETRGASNPYSRGATVSVTAVQFSEATNAHGFPSGTGPVEPQRMIFGYPNREDYRDTSGRVWKPAGEVVARSGRLSDTISAGWWTNAAAGLAGVTDPPLYRHGYHGSDFWVNLTTGPGKYDLGLYFANARELDTTWNCFDILINGLKVVDRLDVTATAGGPNKAANLVFRNISPTNGIIQVRFKGLLSEIGASTRRGEAFIQALELGRNLRLKGVQPVSSQLQPSMNLLLNADFEETASGVASAPGKRYFRNDWMYVFSGSTNDYIYQESEYEIHPDWGPPEYHSGRGALRTHSDGKGHMTVFQDVPAKPSTVYSASVWVRAVDLHGKGFGQAQDDSAGFIIQELNQQEKIIRTHPKTEIRKAGPYVQLAQKVKTGADCAKLRISLDTIIGCHFKEGHVSYDNCMLREESAP